MPLEEKTVVLRLSIRGDKSAYTLESTAAVLHDIYVDGFRQGADLMPRRAVFVDVESNAKSKVLSVRTAKAERENKNNKPPWDAIDFKGTVESEFLFLTLKSDAVLPFVTGPFSRVVLPVIIRDGAFEIVETGELVARGNEHAAQWFRQVDLELVRLGNKKLLSWVSRQNKLVDQPVEGFPRLVAFGAGGTNVCAAIIDTAHLEYPFVNDQTLYVWPAPDEPEARYVCGMLNSTSINERIKEYQPAGDFGEQHVHKLPIALIPKFQNGNPLQQRIVDESRRLSDVAARTLAGKPEFIDISRSLASRRKGFRDAIGGEMGELNELANKALEEVQAE